MKRTKILAMVCAAVLLVALFAGCSGKPAASDGKATVKIGGIGPITGGAAIYGNAVKQGAELAIAEINAKGGVQFEMNFQDDAHDAEKSVNAYNTLMDWGMQVLLGPVTSDPATAVAAEADRDHIFMLTPSGSSTKITDGHENVYQMCFSDPNQGLASAKYISEKKLSEKIAIIYKSDDAYSTGIYEKFSAEAKEKALTVVYTGTFTSDSETDFSAQLTAAKSAGADLLFLPIYYTPISLIMQQAKSIGLDVTYFGVDGMDGLLSLAGFDKSLAEGAYLLTPFSADSTEEKSAAFTKAYREKFGMEPNQFAADAYDCVYAFAQAFDTAGADVASKDHKTICDEMIKQFTSMKFTGLTGAGVAMTWNAAGEISKEPMAVIIKNGVYTSVE